MTLLFITWDGPNTNYLEGLFFPVLANLGLPVHVVQFTGADMDQRTRIARAASAIGVGYDPIHVGGGSASLRALAWIPRGAARIREIARRVGATVLMPRSLIPAAMVLAAGLPQRIVFEADGLMADERVDFGGWPGSSVQYRLARDVEAECVRRAVTTITRTERAKAVLLARGGPSVDEARVRVVANGKDASAFRPPSPEERVAARARLGVGADERVVVYAGSVGPQYLPQTMVRLLALAVRHEPRLRVLFLSPEHATLVGSLRETMPSARVLGRRVDASEMAETLGACDVGIALRRASFSQLAVCPIKVAEYLLVGLPLVTSAGIGDLDSQLRGEPCAHFLADGADSETRAARWIAEVQCPSSVPRAVGLKYFSLDRAIEGYRDAVSSALA